MCIYGVEGLFTHALFVYMKIRGKHVKYGVVWLTTLTQTDNFTLV